MSLRGFHGDPVKRLISRRHMPPSTYTSAAVRPPALSDSIVRGLAALHGSSRRAIESTMALWPSERLAALHHAGLISDPPGGAGHDQCAFSLTSAGAAAIERCGMTF
jgi:hypothetical protein